MNYLKDKNFLKILDESPIKEHFIKLTILTYKDEKVIKEIQGIATAGSLTVNGSSAVRRTISLTISSLSHENNISDISNIISFNKKVKIDIGLKNSFIKYQESYGDLIWFPLGIYVITEANSSTTATNSTINLKGKDKMCMLDGTCGGTLPASVTFHEAIVLDKNNEVSITHPTIFTIIKECVHHYGNELEQNIFINDLDETAKQSVKYMGMEPIYFTEDYSSFIISAQDPDDSNFLAHKFVYGQDIGYKETDFTFPGELIFEAGSTVTQVLDKIIQTLGNYEYFYDLDGRFIFQEKKNYLNHYQTPIMNLNDSFYVTSFTDLTNYQTLENSKSIISYNYTPKYDNIKNDFIVWGSRTDASGTTRNLKYHVAIDEKPSISLANQYMWKLVDYQDRILSYEFDSENKNYINVPNKPILIDFSKEKKSIREINQAIIEQIEIETNKYKNQKEYTLYFKVYNNLEVSYYKVDINFNQKNFYNISLLPDLTDYKIFNDYFITYYPPKQVKINSEEEEEKENNEPSVILDYDFLLTAYQLFDGNVITIHETSNKKKYSTSILFGSIEKEDYKFLFPKTWEAYKDQNSNKLESYHVSDKVFIELLKKRQQWYDSLDERSKILYPTTEDLAYVLARGGKDDIIRDSQLALMTDIIMIPNVEYNIITVNAANRGEYSQKYSGTYFKPSGDSKREFYSRAMIAFLAYNGISSITDNKFLNLMKFRQDNENEKKQEVFSFSDMVLTEELVETLKTNYQLDGIRYLCTDILFYEPSKTINKKNFTTENLTLALQNNYSLKSFNQDTSHVGIINFSQGSKNQIFYTYDKDNTIYNSFIIEEDEQPEKPILNKTVLTEEEFIQYLKDSFWWWSREKQFQIDLENPDEFITWMKNWLYKDLAGNPETQEALEYWWGNLINGNTNEFITKWYLQYAESENKGQGTKEEENVEEKDNREYYIILKLKYDQETNKYQLGYYQQNINTNKIEWKTVATTEKRNLSKELFISLLKNLYLKGNKVNQEYFRIFKMSLEPEVYGSSTKSTDELETTIKNINLISTLNCPAVPNLIKEVNLTYETIEENGEKQTLEKLEEITYKDFEPYLIFNEKKNPNSGYKIGPIAHRDIISYFATIWSKNPSEFITDVVNIINQFNNIENYETITLSILTEADKKSVIDFYKTLGPNESSDVLFNEIKDYYYSATVNKQLFLNSSTDFLFNICTYEPEDKNYLLDYGKNLYYKLIGKPCFEWREELYRQALLNQLDGGAEGYYDDELLTFWRDIFNTVEDDNPTWKTSWYDYVIKISQYLTPGASLTEKKQLIDEIENNFDDSRRWNGWNPSVYTDPGILFFWLDFLDSDVLLTKYSVNQIGRRTIAEKKENINMIYSLEVPDVMFIENTGLIDVQTTIADLDSAGQNYCVLKPNELNYFSSSSNGSTAFDIIREMIYSHLYLNSGVNITCVPKYYLEPNNIIYIYDEKSKIKGNFVISQYTLPLTYNGNMSITTSETLIRV